MLWLMFKEQIVLKRQNYTFYDFKNFLFDFSFLEIYEILRDEEKGFYNGSIDCIFFDSTTWLNGFGARFWLFRQPILTKCCAE